MRYRLKENKGRHVLRNGAQRLDVYPGHIVDDSQWKIPEGMKSDFVALDPISEPKPKLRFKLEHRGGAYFDVIHPVTGVAINSRRLHKAEAESIAGITVEEYDAKVLAEEAEAAVKAAEEAEKAEVESKTDEGAGDQGDADNKSGEGEGAQ